MNDLLKDIKIVRSDRKTLSLEIKPDLSIIVRAPKRVKNSDIRRFVEEKSSWIEKHIGIMKARSQSMADCEKLSEDEIARLTEKAKVVINERVKYFANIIGVKYGRITIRHQVSRWGSCSSKGNLNFNCLLMLCPEKVIDYVVVHELCHRIEMNHSPNFWSEVERVLPDYVQSRKWLRENGGRLIAALRK